MCSLEVPEADNCSPLLSVIVYISTFILVSQAVLEVIIIIFFY